MKLSIGCGIHKPAGWTTIDADPNMNPTYVCNLPSFPSEVMMRRWDEIEWIHGITSLYPWHAQEALATLHLILAPGGKLILEQPNFEIAILHEEWLFGDPLPRNPFIMNRWSYSPTTLAAALIKAGFQEFRTLAAQQHVPERDFRMEVFK